MKISEARQLVQVKAPVLSRQRRVLAGAYNVEEFRKAAEHPDVTKIITDQAADIVTGTPENFAALVKSDGMRLGQIMQAAGSPVQ